MKRENQLYIHSSALFEGIFGDVTSSSTEECDGDRDEIWQEIVSASGQ